MRFPIRFIPEKTNIRFMKLRWWWFAVSLVLTVGTLALFTTRGLTMGIDFTGGILMEIQTEKPASLAPLRKSLEEGKFGEIALQHYGSETQLLLRVQARENENQAKKVEEIKKVVTSELGSGAEFRKIDYVGPSVGKDLIQSGYLSLGCTFVAIMLYMWFRFEWQYGLGGIIALLHDAIMVLGFYIVSGFDFGLTSIAAILTVIGYSINDSVVIYDRIRENMRKYKQMPQEELIDLSINETMARTIMTAGTVALAALALTLFGGEILRGFSAALLFGVVAGTYSSIYISAPVLIYFNLRKEAGAGMQTVGN